MVAPGLQRRDPAPLTCSNSRTSGFSIRQQKRAQGPEELVITVSSPLVFRCSQAVAERALGFVTSKPHSAFASCCHSRLWNLYATPL